MYIKYKKINIKFFRNFNFLKNLSSYIFFHYQFFKIIEEIFIPIKNKSNHLKIYIIDRVLQIIKLISSFKEYRV